MSELQHANRELHEQLARSTAGNTPSTSHTCTQTLQDPLPAAHKQAEHAFTSTDNLAVDSKATTPSSNSPEVPKQVPQGSEGLERVHAATLQRQQGSGGSKDDVLAGVRAVQEEVMRSVLQQMDALANQHICLQVGQVRCEISALPSQFLLLQLHTLSRPERITCYVHTIF